MAKNWKRQTVHLAHNDVARLIRYSGIGITRLAREIGIDPATLRKWKRCGCPRYGALLLAAWFAGVEPLEPNSQRAVRVANGMDGDLT